MLVFIFSFPPRLRITGLACSASCFSGAVGYPSWVVRFMLNLNLLR
jgi:hypothetical protein